MCALNEVKGMMLNMKNKIKILLILLNCILLSGCTVKYNIIIKDKKITENVLITSLKDEIYNEKTNCEYYKENSEKPIISLNKNDIYISILDREKKIEGINYYDTKYIDSDNECNFKLNYTYQLKDYSLANQPKEYLNIFQVDYIDENNYTINVNGITAFPNFQSLTNIIVSIDIDDEVTYHNADEVIDNTYIWKFDTDNYENKKLKLKVGTYEPKSEEITDAYPEGETLEEIKKNDKTNHNENIKEPKEKKDNTKTIIICSVLIFIGLIAYIIFSKKEKNKYK